MTMKKGYIVKSVYHKFRNDEEHDEKDYAIYFDEMEARCEVEKKITEILMGLSLLYNIGYESCRNGGRIICYIDKENRNYNGYCRVWYEEIEIVI